MISLLKQKAKVGLISKERKTYEIKPIFSNKRAKVDEKEEKK